MNDREPRIVGVETTTGKSFSNKFLGLVGEEVPPQLPSQLQSSFGESTSFRGTPHHWTRPKHRKNIDPKLVNENAPNIPKTLFLGCKWKECRVLTHVGDWKGFNNHK